MTKMTREDVIALAKQARFIDRAAFNHAAELERFAALVAAAEREACASVCDSHEQHWLNGKLYSHRHGASQCAAAIRARGTT